MNSEDLKARTKALGLSVLNLIDDLPKTTKGYAVANQIARSATSVGANYRAACRGRSKAEFAAKLGTVIEEADETAFWLELIMEGNLMSRDRVQPLWNEADELVAIMTASRKTVKAGMSK